MEYYILATLFLLCVFGTLALLGRIADELEESRK